MNPVDALKKMPRVRRPRSQFALGVAFVVVAAVVGGLLAMKPQIQSWLMPGETIKAEFSSDYRLRPHKTKVKVSGLEVGVVTHVEHPNAKTTVVSMKVNDSGLDALGQKPSVHVEPLTVLGGAYMIELHPGGRGGRFEGEFIPKERTHLPVELDRILESLPRPTRESSQNVVEQFEETLARGGGEALRDLVASAPDTLKPASSVLEAVQGARPSVDLPQIVANFHSVASVLDRHEGQLGSIVDSLNDTTRVLAEQSMPLAAGFESLPETLRTTRTGLTDLRGSMERLGGTAASLHPTVMRLDPLLRKLAPVLEKARPLMRDLRPLLADAPPTIGRLSSVAERGSAVLGDLRGPVLERVNGPITDVVMNTFRGKGPYKNTGGGIQADHKFYEELGYLVTNLDRASMLQDAQGSTVGFQVGVGSRSLVGTPFTLENLMKEIEKVAGGAR